MNILNVYTDGGARGNPGPAAIGYVIYQKSVLSQNIEVIKKGIYIGYATNNIAEYSAVLESLKYIKNHSDKLNFNEINYFIDSKLVVEQLKGNYRVKDINLKSLYQKILLLKLEIGININFSHINRELNLTADSLVNQALDKGILI